MIQNSSINSVLILPDGRIARDRKEAKEMLGVGKYTFTAMFKDGTIKRIPTNKLSTGDEQSNKS